MSGKLLAWRAVCLSALALTTSSLADEWRSEPLFCGFESGCEAVTRSWYGRPLGVPLPVVGVLAFGGFFLLTLVPGALAGVALRALAVLAGLAGLGLVLIQASLGQFCQLCLLIDGCGLLLAVIELASPAPADGKAIPAWQAALWGAAALLAAAGPLVWALYLRPAPPVPEEVLALQAPGRVTVVFVTDFECEHCRFTHGALKEVLAGRGERVRLHTLVFPLPTHANARDAARAYHCAAAQGRGDAMAEALFAATDLSPAGCERVAGDLKLDLARYRACLKEPATEEALGVAAWVTRIGAKGLPVLWVGGRRLVGPQTAATLEAALRAAGVAEGGE